MQHVTLTGTGYSAVLAEIGVLSAVRVLWQCNCTGSPLHQVQRQVPRVLAWLILLAPAAPALTRPALHSA
jgi:hypothetical protein